MEVRAPIVIPNADQSALPPSSGPPARRSRPSRERLAWAVLGSAWVHIGLGFLLLLGSTRNSSGEPTKMLVLRVGSESVDGSDETTPPDRGLSAPLERPLSPQLILSEVLRSDRQHNAERPVSEARTVMRQDAVQPEREIKKTPPAPTFLVAVRLDTPGERPAAAQMISSENATAIRHARQMVLAPVSGPAIPKSEGHDRAEAADHARRQRGTVARRAGSDAVLPNTESEKRAAGSGGGGRSSHASTGSTGQGGEHREGGAPARAGGGSARPDMENLAAGTGGQTGYRVGAGGDRAPKIADGGSGNSPARAASAGDPRPKSAAQDASDAASATDGDGVAMALGVGERGDRGGAPDDGEDDPSRQALHLDRRDGDGDGDSRGPVDPVLELQEAMGWSRPEYRDPEQQAQDIARRRGLGAPRTSPQTVVDDIAVRDFVSVSARKDPLGRYIRQVEDVLYKRWQQSEIPIGDRARGIQGACTVRYTIDASGRVRDLRLVRSSGNKELDLLALSAVPNRVPRIPRQLDRSRIEHQVVLRYRNPLIATALERP